MEELEQKNQQADKEEVQEEVKLPVRQKRKAFFLASFGIILLAAVLVLIFQMNQSKRTTEFKQVFPTALPTVIEEEIDKTTQKLEIQSSSDEIGAIEKDLRETELENLDQELEDLEKEILIP